MSPHRSLLIVPAALALAALTACAAEAQPTQTTPPAAEDADHGEVEGAAEVAEPPLALFSIDADGAVGLLDLVSGDTTQVGSGDSPTALASDGRYGFVTTAGGLEIVDSGRWSWDHGDHFHYYLAEPALLGTVPGEGETTVTTGMLSTAGATGVFFADSGEAVLLDNESLGDGEVVELFRLETGADAGIVAPLEDGALVTDGDELVFHDAEGSATDATAECVDPSGAITTRVALVVGCADGAILATWDDGAPMFERVPYPAEVDADRAMAFDGRKGRPTVAALSGTTGFWLLDTRNLAWQHVPTDVALARVSAVDDDQGHVVALDGDGRVHVYRAESGEEIAVTEPLLTEVGPTVSLTVDGQRAYVNDPVAGVVLEIDYADGARIARTLETPTAPDLVAEVGR